MGHSARGGDRFLPVSLTRRCALLVGALAVAVSATYPVLVKR